MYDIVIIVDWVSTRMMSTVQFLVAHPQLRSMYDALINISYAPLQSLYDGYLQYSFRSDSDDILIIAHQLLL